MLDFASVNQLLQAEMGNLATMDDYTAKPSNMGVYGDREI